jgi:hypothetical protein
MREDEKKIRDILELARRCVLRCQAPQGLAQLESVRLEIDDWAGTSMSAEYELVYAGALGAMRDQGAEYAFEDAFKRISELSEADPALKMRAHGDFGKYLAEQRSFIRAREQYRLAEKIAETLDQAEEDLAHFQMCLIGIELQEQREPRLRAFQNLRRAALMDGCTDTDQREAWFQYIDEFQRDGRHMVAARMGNDASVDYFRGALSQIRRRRSEVVK